MEIKIRLQNFMKKPSTAFGCSKTGDLIQFVQYLFNLTFKEAMQKINEDFNLGLNSNTKIDYKKIERIKREKKAKQQYLKGIENKIKHLCEIKTNLKNKIEFLESEINLNNWEEKVFIMSKLQESIYKTDTEIDELFELLYKAKNS